MAKYKTTEKTPRRWNGRPTPNPGTIVEMAEDEAEYEVQLGILEPAELEDVARSTTAAKSTAAKAVDNSSKQETSK